MVTFLYLGIAKAKDGHMAVKNPCIRLQTVDLNGSSFGKYSDCRIKIGKGTMPLGPIYPKLAPQNPEKGIGVPIRIRRLYMQAIGRGRPCFYGKLPSPPDIESLSLTWAKMPTIPYWILLPLIPIK